MNDTRPARPPFNITLPATCQQWNCIDDLAGKTLVMMGVEAFGENINLLVVCRQLRKICRYLLLALPDPLVALCRASNLADDVIAFSDEKMILADYYVNILDVAQKIQIEVTGQPYLQVDDGLFKLWRRRMASLPPLRVGLAWQGEPARPGDDVRSSDLTQFAPFIQQMLGRQANICFVSLQKGKKELSTYAPEWGQYIWDSAPHLSDFHQSAAIMKNLSMVISTDTAVPHLAGALGVRVVLLLPNAGTDWRWKNDTIAYPLHETIWYSNMSVMRKYPGENWPNALHRLGELMQFN